MPGPERKLFEKFGVWMPAGTNAKIDAVLRGGELRSAFVRTAIKNEIESRSKQPPKKARTPTSG